MVSPIAESSDETLAARAAVGESAALAELVERYRSRVFRLAVRLTDNESDAADVLQETFLLVVRRLGTFRGDSSFSTWLYRVATNAALMQRRSHNRRPTESLESFLPRFDEAGRHCATPAELQTVCRIEEVLDRKSLARRAREGLERLPETYRAAFVLRDLEDLPTTDVAQILGSTPAAVRQRVHRARLMLRGFLNELPEVRS